MKKNIQLLIISLLATITTNVQAQECCVEEPCYYDAPPCYYEDNCCFDKKSFYTKVFSGANFLQNTTLSGNKAKYDVGYIIAGSLGYHWRNNLRVEAEYAFRRNEISKIDFVGEGSSHHGHFQTSSYMANLLWDLSLCAFWNIQSFVGAGVGYDCQQMHSSNSLIIFNQKWHHFSWQVMAGLAYPIFCNTQLTLEYKFHQGGCHFYNNAVGVGLIYAFAGMK